MVLTETVREVGAGKCEVCDSGTERVPVWVPMVLDEMLKWVSLAEARKRNGVSLF